MYSREERMKAVKLYMKYDKSAAAVLRELGSPDRKTLRSWYRIFLKEEEFGIPHNQSTHPSQIHGRAETLGGTSLP